MRQVLFNIPLPHFSWLPSGIPESFPVYGFGLMLFLTFITCTLWASWRAKKEGVNPQFLQDLAVWIFIGGIIGARIVYMIQYHVPISQFFEIWKGGLVFYGSAVGGVFGYAAAWLFVLRKHQVSTRQLADIVAAPVAWGLMLGRIGCLLNGCCYGHVACADCPAIHFPLGAPPRYSLVQNGSQTAGGFTLADPGPLSRIGKVEEGSPAAEAGLRENDVVLKVNGEPNRRILEVSGTEAAVNEFGKTLGQTPFLVRMENGLAVMQFSIDTQEEYEKALIALKTADPPVTLERKYDTLWDVIAHKWPRGRDELELTVKHATGEEQALSFVPRTIGLHPTQLYETVSMFLLFLLLNAYFPFRRHYGEVFVLLIFCYTIHRFVNESLRNDTDPVFNSGDIHLTLSQVGSILFALVGAGLFIWIRRQPPDKALEGPAPEVDQGAKPVPA